MKILILGSGVIGVTMAYELGKRGFEVTVLDRQAESGAETSYANGGQLSYSHGEPWANPSVLPKLPGWLFRSDAPLVFRLRADWQMVRWGLHFLRNCTAAHAATNCANLMRIGLYSREKMAALCSDTGIQFDQSKRGILSIFSTDADFDHAKRQSDFQAKFGGAEKILSPEDCFALEPALRESQRSIIGGIHSFLDETGDAHSYCAALSALASERYNVRFHYGVTMEDFREEENRIAAVVTDQGDISADTYIMAMGSYSPLFLKPLGIDLPIYPMKGYSITLPANDHCPQASVTDDTYKIVYSRLGDRLRIAGTAEFAGYDTSINEKRIAPMIKAARELFPQAGWDREISKWACLRSSTPDGPPVLGPTPYRNLFLNTGHGTLGWTQAAGSATLVADAVEGKTPGILVAGLTMERYL